MRTEINNQEYFLDWQYGWGHIVFHNTKGDLEDKRVEKTTCFLRRRMQTVKAGVPVTEMEVIANAEAFCSPYDTFTKKAGRKASLKRLLDSRITPRIHAVMKGADVKKERAKVWDQYCIATKIRRDNHTKLPQIV